VAPVVSKARTQGGLQEAAGRKNAAGGFQFGSRWGTWEGNPLQSYIAAARSALKNCPERYRCRCPTKRPPVDPVDAGARWPRPGCRLERLCLSPDGLLKRTRRGQLQAQRDNHGRWQVRVDALSDADKSRRPRTRPARIAADLKAQIAELEAERNRLHASLEAAQKALADALIERDRLVQHVRAARSETAETRAAADRKIIELSGSINQLSETLSEALSEAKAREARMLSEADKARALAQYEADKAEAELARERLLIEELKALPWWRRLLGRW